MIWLAVVALGNMCVTIWLLKENRRYIQMTISRHAAEYATMVKADAPVKKTKKKVEDEEIHSGWRSPSEGVAP